jgi:hypothetical protein
MEPTYIKKSKQVSKFQSSVCVSVEEKKLVDEVFRNAMDVLSEEDR